MKNLLICLFLLGTLSLYAQKEGDEVIQEYDGIVKKTKITDVNDSRLLGDSYISTELTERKTIKYLDTESFKESIHKSVKQYGAYYKGEQEIFTFMTGDRVFLRSFGRGSEASEIIDITDKGYILLDYSDEYVHFSEIHRLIVN